MSGKTFESAYHSIKSVSVIAMAAENDFPFCFPSAVTHSFNNLVRISVL